MDSDRWQRIQTLFHQAADVPAAEQRIFLETQCAGDPVLVSEIMILLEEDARGTSLLDGGIAHVANQILSSQPDAPPPFKEFGPYRIVRALGEGGMGVVYLAERADLGTHVAVKILRDAWLSPGRRNLFAAEQRTLAQLNHPSIARLYDADTSPDGSDCLLRQKQLLHPRPPAPLSVSLRGGALRAPACRHSSRSEALQRPRKKRRNTSPPGFWHLQTSGE